MSTKELEQIAKQRLQQLSSQNECLKEYSLGDVLLLSKYEKILRGLGYSVKEIKALSPTYYLSEAI